MLHKLHSRATAAYHRVMAVDTENFTAYVLSPLAAMVVFWARVCV